jgi:predicted ferric reductase
VGAIIGALTLVVVGLWSRHGGVTALGDSAAKTYTSLAQLTGLLCSEAGLLGLILITRTPLVERRYGLDRMLNWHRLLGEAMAIFLALHIAFSIAAWAIPNGAVNAINRTYFYTSCVTKTNTFSTYNMTHKLIFSV